jgi:hypothetical protein
MPQRDLGDTLRQLMAAAVAFEKKAARHARIESERRALLDAITRAQLELSVGNEAPGNKPVDAPARGRSQPTVLRGIPGGRRATTGATKPTQPSKQRRSKNRRNETAARDGHTE